MVDHTMVDEFINVLYNNDEVPVCDYNTAEAIAHAIIMHNDGPSLAAKVYNLPDRQRYVESDVQHAILMAAIDLHINKGGTERCRYFINFCYRQRLPRGVGQVCIADWITAESLVPGVNNFLLIVMQYLESDLLQQLRTDIREHLTNHPAPIFDY